jgi:cell division septation protein DedD
MEEQTSWKGHTFTLMVFGGIVVLCSIFFVLGMLVGRTQSIKLAALAAADAAPKLQPKDTSREELPERVPRINLEPVKPAPPPPAAISSPKPEEREATPPHQPTTVTLQIAAHNKRSDAEKQVDALKKKGFRAFMLTPTSDDPKPLYRVQVGAADAVAAESLKRKLEAAGFKPFLKPR